MNHRVSLHIGFWLAYILLNAYIAIGLYQSSSEMAYALPIRFLRSAISELAVLPLKLIPTYFIFYYLIPKHFYADQYLLMGFKAFIVLFVVVILHRLEVYYVIVPALYHGDYPSYSNFSIARILYTFVEVVSIVGVAVAIKLGRINLQSWKREQLLQQEKLESELHFLRAQTNPHFLFNTLNNIYALARKNSKNTANVVMKLSKLLRFMLYECTAESISISEEINVIKDYIELEKLRYEYLNIQWEEKIDHKNQQIAPLLLLPFVENAFKHGASENRFETNIDISFFLENKRFQFKISNTKLDEEHTIKEGIGLNNVKRQLELIYKNKYELSIESGPENFIVNLELNFNK